MSLSRPAARFWTKSHRMSFRARVGTLIAVAVGLTVALASFASYFVVKHQLVSQTNSALTSDLSSLPSFPGNTIDPNQAGRLLSQFGGGAFLQVIGRSGTVYYSSLQTGGVAPTRTEIREIGASGGYVIDTISYNGTPYRVITAPAQYDMGTGPIPAAIQIGRPVGDIDRTLRDMRLILWVVTLGGIALAVGFGYVIGRDTLRPVSRLTAAAEHVTATQDLSASIEVSGDDELARLARAFNAMLAALAESRQQQAQLISDAGHELRTPLTSLRTNIEVLMRMPDLPEADRSELTADVEAQLGELTNLIGDVVDLARQEERQPEAIEVRLDSIVEHAVERARRRAPGLTFDVHLTPGSVRAQPALLERAVLNVLDNAAKWSPRAGTVEVWLQRGGVWTLDIHDHGPGIAASDLPHVFDRFYRADSARSMPGSGLGLAIVHQVVAGHGGSVTASVPPEGGTLVHIQLPIVAEEEAPGDLDRVGPAGPGQGPDPYSEAARWLPQPSPAESS